MSLQKYFSQCDEYIKKIDQRVRMEDFKRVEGTEKNLSNLKQLFSDLKRIKGEIEGEYGLLSNEKQKEYNFKLKTLRSDVEMRNTSINRIEEKYNQNRNMNNLMSGNAGNMSRKEINATTRDAILDLHKQTDYQQDLLGDIKNDLLDTRTNMKGMTVEVKKQGETLDRVQMNLQDANTAVKRTDKNISQMQRREFCHKLLMHILALLLFISIIIAIIYKLTRK